MWLIPSAVGVAVVVMASTVWASVSLIDFGGPQPESVLPASSIAFGRIDLSIDGSQAIDLLGFVDRLPDELTEGMGEPSDDMTATFAEGFVEVFPEASQSEVEEWIGERVGFSVWPSTDEEASLGIGATFAVAVAVTDEPLAEETLSGVAAARDDLAYEMVDGFAVMTDNDAALTERTRQMEAHGALAADSVFSGDLADVPGSSLAVAWADVSGALAVEELAAELELDGVGDFDGRMTASVRVDGDYLEARMDAFALQVEGTDVSWLSGSPGSGVDAMSSLPESTIAAVGAVGLDRALTDAYNSGELALGGAERADVEAMFDAWGAPLPGGFTSLLGSSSTLGITNIDLNGLFSRSTYHGGFVSPSDEAFSFVYRAVGADEQVLGTFVEQSATGPYSDSPSVTAEGDTVVVSRGASASGSLGDDPVFQQTMQDMDDAVIAGFFDLRQALEGTDVADASQWGALGLAVSVVEDGRHSSLELRWAPSGGE
ncbi:hypothetical protein [Nocardiopsis sp. CNT312]|uniref:hypothetical protein n=1 Tax=Nocardiopsis sp. CNT312 TaxID=1137268 RepID=UPI0004B75CA8|nr:hypothetical protein [Nocardiopsis sp. CNT312]